MTMRNTTERYGTLSIGLHWVMVLLLIAVYACINLSGEFPKGSYARDALKTWHFMLGLSVLVLVLLRLAVTLASPTPRIVPSLSKWQHLSAKVMHVALYVLMVCLPIAGWLILSANGKPIPFFGLHLPALLGENKELGKLIKEVHETGATVGYFLIGLHAAAGLYHHYFLRDNTLLRMLPTRS
jgi:cytochrome b561